MKTLFATILILMLCGCARNGDQNNRQAESIRQGDLSRPFATEQIPLRDVLPAPAAATAPEQKSERRAEVVPLDVEVQSTASNNANQQSATGVINTQVAKIAESVEASLVRAEAKITAQNEMVANLQNTMNAQATAIATLQNTVNVQATAIANLRADVSANAQAGIGNSQSATTAGRDAVTQFSDGMERLMTRMVVAMEHAVSAVKWIVGGAVLSCVTGLYSIIKIFARLLETQERSRLKEELGESKTLETILKILKGTPA